MTQTTRCRATLSAALVAAGVLTLGALPAHAADTNNEPITLVVPFAPGGSLDATARAIGPKLASELGQPVVVLNRPGGGSSVGARAVAQAKPDGNTLFVTSGSAFGFMHLLIPNFELGVKDFAPLAGIAINTSLIAVNQKTPAQNLDDLIKLAQTKPNGLSFCTTGANGLNHLQLEMFKELATAKNDGKPLNIVHVPYNGLAPAMTALRAGEVDACTLPYSGLVKQLHGNELRILAVQRGTRMANLPDVPTTGEQGFGAMDANDQFVMVLAPAGTPADVQARLEKALEVTMTDPAIVKTLTEIDVQPIHLDAAETRAWLVKDVEKLSNIIRNANLAIKN